MTTAQPTPSPDVLVSEFHTAFAVPEPTTPGPASLDFDRSRLRMALIEEEFCELLDAYYGKRVGSFIREAITAATTTLDEGERDVVGVTDALADMIYVEYGYAREARIPLDAALAEVHRANMSKLGDDGRPVILTDPPGKIGKGKNYSPPNLRRVLALAAAQAAGHPVAYQAQS